MIDYGIGGKIALVTGAGKGIGRRLLFSWPSRGAAVALVGRSSEPLKAVEKEIRDFPRMFWH